MEPSLTTIKWNWGSTSPVSAPMSLSFTCDREGASLELTTGEGLTPRFLQVELPQLVASIAQQLSKLMPAELVVGLRTPSGTPSEAAE